KISEAGPGKRTRVVCRSNGFVSGTASREAGKTAWSVSSHCQGIDRLSRVPESVGIFQQISRVTSGIDVVLRLGKGGPVAIDVTRADDEEATISAFVVNHPIDRFSPYGHPLRIELSSARNRVVENARSAFLLHSLDDMRQHRFNVHRGRKFG